MPLALNGGITLITDAFNANVCIVNLGINDIYGVITGQSSLLIVSVLFFKTNSRAVLNRAPHAVSNSKLIVESAAPWEGGGGTGSSENSSAKTYGQNRMKVIKRTAVNM